MCIRDSFLAAEEERTVAVADNRVRRVLVDGLELTLGLQDDGCRDFPEMCIRDRCRGYARQAAISRRFSAILSTASRGYWSIKSVSYTHLHALGGFHLLHDSV